jgi:cytochrome c biogenesis protein CcdA
MLGPLLSIALLLGVRHALEGDHVAAVAALATGSAAGTAKPLRQSLRMAIAWGCGHAVVVVLVGLGVVGLGLRIPAALRPGLEIAAGIMLILLGVDVLRRVRSLRAVTGIADGALPGGGDGARRFLMRAFIVGGVHGMEGSAALVLASLPAFRSTAGALAYLAVFGFGSIGGMMACSAAIALPLHAGARRLGRALSGIQVVVGISSIAIGAWIASHVRF